MITVYTICYNEEFMLPHFIRHYRLMFPDCNIVVYDNESTDRTVEIAHEHYCTVKTYTTGGKLDDLTYLEIKNNCWRDAPTDWVLVADCDEFLDIDRLELKMLQNYGATIVKADGYNMVNMNDDMNFNSINHGVRATSYDKIYLFNRKFINEINYGAGAHNANPVGKVFRSYHSYLCRHYKYINPDYMVARHKVFASRLSEKNLEKGYGGHYLYSEEQIRNEFADARKQAKSIK